MEGYKGIAIHFGEIWLKGKNRNDFINRLYGNVELALRGESYGDLRNMRDRFYLTLNSDSDIASMERKLSRVFGINRFSPVMATDNDLDKMVDASNKLLKAGDKVRIVPHRSVKTLDFDSRGIVSHFIENKEKLGFEIDKDAGKELYINSNKDSTFVYTEKIPGAGGLPVGSSGSAVVLLSGGIDSPVAAFYAMKRGLLPVYMHVHAFASNSDEKLSKIRNLIGALSTYYQKPKAYAMPGHVFQSYALKAPKKYELVLFKMFLYRLADRIADTEGADCIVGGESLGQVASQTVRNIEASQSGTSRFIMRPLIGFDKQEIIDTAKRIGTYDESIKEYKDVCSIVARDPATRSGRDTIRRLWEKTSMDSAVELTLEKCTAMGG
ncbi:MAG: tRNA uracil 4-sulfurtransferase ThiI [Candidatus Micrarchaeaceae archaeon]